MTEYLFPALAVISAGVSWYCYRWGHSDGREDGYAAGYADRSLEVLPPTVTPQGGGGPAVPEK